MSRTPNTGIGFWKGSCLGPGSREDQTEHLAAMPKTPWMVVCGGFSPLPSPGEHGQLIRKEILTSDCDNYDDLSTRDPNIQRPEFGN